MISLTLQFDIFEILTGLPNDPDFEKKPVIIQGITGSFGSTHTKLMKSYGTNVTAGVTPGKGGSNFEAFLYLLHFFIKQQKKPLIVV